MAALAVAWQSCHQLSPSQSTDRRAVSSWDGIPNIGHDHDHWDVDYPGRVEDAIVMLPFDFKISGTPRSLNSGSGKEGGPWQRSVKNAAERRWGRRGPVAGDLAVSITWLCERFQPDRAQPDVDNIAKPIIDALKGLVYDSDASVTDVLCRRRSQGSISARGRLSSVLMDCLYQSGDSVYVVVDEAPINEVHIQWKI